MRISARGRYAIAAMMALASAYDSLKPKNVQTVSTELDVSKLYLEQVFTLLKQAELVRATKGAQGGYMLLRAPEKISAYDILSAVESFLFEPTAPCAGQTGKKINSVLQETVFQPMDKMLAEFLKGISLEQLTKQLPQEDGWEMMAFI